MTYRYFIKTLGCQMNEHDSERIAGVLEACGSEAVESVEEANLIIFNTCCIRENADNKLYGQLGRLKEKKLKSKELKIVVAGCLAQKDKDLILKKAPYVDLVVGTFNLTKIDQLLLESNDGPRCVVDEPSYGLAIDEYEQMPVKRSNDFSAWVTIQIGCNNSCSFCIVPSVRGPELSRPVGEIIKEVKALVKQGVQEVTLLGQNVNSYGRDLTLKLYKGQITPDNIQHFTGEIYFDEIKNQKVKVVPLFAYLLRELAQTGIKRIRFTSPHPKDLSKETLYAMKETASVCPQLHLPLQSGSNRILKLMKRGYTKERYLEKFWMAKEIIPELSVSTDIIVGFPSETEDDFEETMQVASICEYDSAYTFIFSPRPFTQAAEMTEHFVGEEIKTERLERLKTVTEKSAFKKNQLLVGSVQEVLVEGPSKKNKAIFTGRNPQNKVVHFRPHQGLKPGSIVNVEIKEGLAHYLMGEMVGVIHEPKPLRRLPVAVL